MMKSIISRLFEVDNSAIHTPYRSKEMQDLAHLPNNQRIKGLWKHSPKLLRMT